MTTREEFENNDIHKLLGKVYDVIVKSQKTYECVLEKYKLEKIKEPKISIFGSDIRRIKKEDFMSHAFINIRWFYEPLIVVEFYDSEEYSIKIPEYIINLQETELVKYITNYVRDLAEVTQQNNLFNITELSRINDSLSGLIETHDEELLKQTQEIYDGIIKKTNEDTDKEDSTDSSKC